MRSSLALFLALAGCSLGNVKTTTCTSSAECRDAFGFGWTCGDTGYCDAIEVEARCTNTYPDDLFSRPDTYSDALVLGALFDFDTAIENLQSIELALDEANIDGGLDGRLFAMVSCNYSEDSTFDQDTSMEAAIRLTEWLSEDVGVTASVGPGSSPKVEEIWPTSSAAGMLLVAPSATSDRLTTIDGETSSDADPGLFWRTAPPDSIQAAAIARDIGSRATEVAIIHQVGAYGEGLAEGIDAELSLPVTSLSFANSNDLTAAIAQIGNGTADEVIFASSDPLDVSAFLNGASATGDYDTKRLFLTDSARDGAVIAAATNAEALFPNIRGSVPVPDPTASATLEDTFYLAYSQRYGQDAARDGFNTFSYDAAWLALYGAAWATFQEGNLEGVSMARGLRRLADPGGPSIPINAASWSDVQGHFQDGIAVDVFGASGLLDFDPNTGETSNPTAIWTLVQDGPDWVFSDELLCPTDGPCGPYPAN